MEQENDKIGHNLKAAQDRKNRYVDLKRKHKEFKLGIMCILELNLRVPLIWGIVPTWHLDILGHLKFLIGYGYLHIGLDCILT